MKIKPENENWSRAQILQVQLLKRNRQPLNSAFLLCPEALLPLLARYLRRQQISFRISAPLAQQKRLLFFTQDRNDQKKSLPRFVLSYLQELSRCRLFYRCLPAADVSWGENSEAAVFLVEYGFQHPLPADEIADHLPGNSLYCLYGDPLIPALIIEPTPPFKNDCELTKSQAEIEQSQYSLPFLKATAPTPILQLKLRLVDDSRQLGSTRALYLKDKEIKWLETLYQRLPGPLLARLLWAGNREHGLILVPEGENLALLPFAEPLKKFEDKLYLPLSQSFSPQLDKTQLENVLGLHPDRLTFITQKWRFDIAEKDFQPLAQMIMTTTPFAATLKFSTPDDDFTEAFTFSWKDHAKARENEIEAEDGPKSQAETRSAADCKPAPLTITRNPPAAGTIPETTHDPTAPPTAILKEYALKLRRENDFLGAATCFSLADEALAAAECYRLAALACEQENTISE
ncbi:MAG: hypothetical protein JXR80_07950 [Deltaproteobacteria bacterium]|nr:hypothetical protein [Deltaproteobacteria bacterium]